MSTKWHSLGPSDMEMYNRYYSLVTTNITDLTFHCRFAWDNIFRIEWTIIEDCLVQISDGGGFTNPFMLMPLGELTPAKIEGIIREVRPVFDTRGWELRIQAIDEPYKDIFEQVHGIEALDFDSDYSDYFYDAESLRTLSGSKYIKKRNHWNRFQRLYPDHVYESLSPSVFDECLELVRFWAEEKGISIDDASESDYYMIKRVFDNWNVLSARGGAIRIDGKIAAFSVGSAARGQVGFIHFEKADIKYDGIYAAINKLVLENEYPEVKYVNREEDLGIPGLRKAKGSYYPICQINKWRTYAK